MIPFKFYVESMEAKIDWLGSEASDSIVQFVMNSFWFSIDLVSDILV